MTKRNRLTKSSIPQWAWDAASATVVEYDFQQETSSRSMEFIIARALVATKAEQREADTKIAENDVANALEPTIGSDPDYVRGAYIQACNDVAAAIRKGGQDDR